MTFTIPMPRLPQTFYYWRFDRGVSALERAYEASIRGVASDLADNQNRLGELDLAWHNGEIDAEEPGMMPFALYWEHFRSDELGQALQFARQASVITVYHFWERQVDGWSRAALHKPSTRHEDHIKVCRRIGLSLDEVALSQLHVFTNFLKHGVGGGDWAQRVRDAGRADLLIDRRHELGADITEVEKQAYFNDAQVKAFFDVVRQSGPPKDREWIPAIKPLGI